MLNASPMNGRGEVLFFFSDPSPMPCMCFIQLERVRARPVRQLPASNLPLLEHHQKQPALASLGGQGHHDDAQDLRNPILKDGSSLTAEASSSSSSRRYRPSSPAAGHHTVSVHAVGPPATAPAGSTGGNRQPPSPPRSASSRAVALQALKQRHKPAVASGNGVKDPPPIAAAAPANVSASASASASATAPASTPASAAPATAPVTAAPSSDVKKVIHPAPFRPSSPSPIHQSSRPVGSAAGGTGAAAGPSRAWSAGRGGGRGATSTGYASSALAMAAAARLRGGTTPTRSSSSEAVAVSERQLGSAVAGALSPRALHLVATAAGKPRGSPPSASSSSPARAAADAEVRGLREDNQQLTEVCCSVEVGGAAMPCLFTAC